jgi:methionyl-tRNA formyltransferase
LAVELAADVTIPAERERGTVFEQNRGVYVVTGQGALRLVTVQPAGKKEMSAEAMLNGQPELLGAVLHSSRQV